MVEARTIVHFDDTTHVLLQTFFSSVQKDDKMSERLAEPVTESASAKQWPVRNFFALANLTL